MGISSAAKAKIDAILKKNGGPEGTFKAYAGKDGEMDLKELTKLVNDAGVSSAPIPKKLAVKMLRDNFDTDGNGLISWPELKVKLK